MKHIKIRFFILAVSICLITIVLGFAGGIDIASFKKNYTESLVASYSVAGAEPVRKIEYAVKYGKPLANFYGIYDLLSETKNDFPEIQDIKIILPDGEVAYNLSEDEESSKISDDVRQTAFSDKAMENSNNYIYTGNQYHITIPVKDSQKTQIGALDIVLESSVLNIKINDYSKRIMFFLLIIVLVSIALVIALFMVTPVIKANGDIDIKAVTFILIAVLTVSQLLFGLINYNLYRKIYIETSRENTSMVVQVVQRDMNVVIQKGVPVTELNGIESWLNAIVQSVPEIESLHITNMRGEVYYKTKNLILMQEELIDPMYNYSLPLTKDNMSQKGLVNLVLSKKHIEKKLFEIALDALTVIIISFIFMTEIIILLMLFLKRRREMGGEAADDGDADELTELKLIRPIAFVFFFAFSLTSSFLPLVMKGFNTSLLWMPESLKLSLPVSLEAFGTIVSTIITGYAIHKKGWRPPFFCGILVVCAGSVLSGISFNGTMFILARLITGIGYGLSWMAMRGYVSTFNSASAQTQGFSSLNSGIMSGLNCGIVLGAMIAERAGYSFVFYIIVGLMIVSAVISLLLIKNNKKESNQDETQKNTIIRDMKKLVLDFKVIAYILLVILPASVCGVFLSYLFPVVGTEMGISSANIGRAFLLYGLFVVYLGPLFGKYSGNKAGIGKSIVTANIICSLAILFFGFGLNTVAAFSAVMLLGLSDSFGLAAQVSYFLSFDASKKAGSGISMAVCSVFYKVGQMIGPLVFGALITLGTGTGTVIIGIAVAVLIIVYVFLNRNTQIKSTNKSMEI